MKNVKLLYYFNFLNNFRLYGAVAILYFSDIAGSFALGMGVFSIIQLSSAFFEIPTGAFSDLYGRRKTMVLGAIADTVSIVLYAVSGSITLLMLGAVMSGLANALFSGNNDSLLHDSLADENRQEMYATWRGKVESFTMLGLSISALLGSILASWSFRYMMWASVLPMLLSIFVALMVGEPKRESGVQTNIFTHLKEAIFMFRQNRKLRLLSIIKIWNYALDESAYKFNSAFVQLVWPVWAIGFRNFLGKLIGSISFATSGSLIEWIGSKEKVLYIRSIWDHVSRFMALLFPGVWSPVLMTTNAYWWAAGQTAESGLLQAEFTSRQRSTMASLVSFGQSILFAIFAYLVGALGDLFGPIQALLIFQVLKLSLLPLLWKLFRSI